MEINDQIKIIKDTVEKYKGMAHILTPIPRAMDLGELSIPQYTRVSVRTVWISSKREDGETYSLKKSPHLFILNKIGLQKLGAAAGIEWSDPITFIAVDEPLVAAATIKGTITNLDGTLRSSKVPARLDYRDGSAQLKSLDPAMVPLARASILSRVETAAKNRVRRELLGVQNSYTAAELEKPFVLFTLVKDEASILHDFPVLRKALALQYMGISAELFQASTQPDPVGLPESTVPLMLLPASVTEEHKSVIVQTTVDEILKKEETPTPQSAPKPDMAGCPDPKLTMTAKLSQVVDAYAKKGLVRGKNKPMLADLTEDQLDAILASLSTLPDKKS